MCVESDVKRQQQPQVCSVPVDRLHYDQVVAGRHPLLLEVAFKETGKKVGSAIFVFFFVNG